MDGKWPWPIVVERWWTIQRYLNNAEKEWLDIFSGCHQAAADESIAGISQTISQTHVTMGINESQTRKIFNEYH